MRITRSWNSNSDRKAAPVFSQIAKCTGLLVEWVGGLQRLFERRWQDGLPLNGMGGNSYTATVQGGSMADIFVSYRRDDSQWPAGRINERLEAVFGAGRVFFDTVTIRPGEDFHEVLGAKVGACRVLLAVIGPRWLDLLEGRLGVSSDFVRIEIAEGLRRKVRVIPVLIDGAKPPPEGRLPDDLKALARHNAVLVRAGHTFRSDLDQLIGFLREFLDGSPDGVAPRASTTPCPPASGSGLTRMMHAEDGRIKVDAKIIHGAPDGWFKPGAGKTEWFKDIDIGPEIGGDSGGELVMGSNDPTTRSHHTCDDQGTVRGRPVLCHVRGVGRGRPVRNSDRRGLGPRPATGDQRVLGGCEGLHRLALAQDW